MSVARTFKNGILPSLYCTKGNEINIFKMCKSLFTTGNNINDIVICIIAIKKAQPKMEMSENAFFSCVMRFF